MYSLVRQPDLTIIAWPVVDSYVKNGYLLVGERNTQNHNLIFSVRTFLRPLKQEEIDNLYHKAASLLFKDSLILYLLIPCSPAIKEKQRPNHEIYGIYIYIYIYTGVHRTCYLYNPSWGCDISWLPSLLGNLEW